MNTKRTILFAALGAVALAPACGRNNARVTTVQTFPVARRDIIIDAQANGVVEPINIVEVKSKAGGQIIKMPVETGTNVRPGDLIVQIDARDVQNQYNQAEADLRAAEARLAVSKAAKARSDELFAARVITQQEQESASLELANSEATVIRQRANLDLAKQRLEDATVSAPVAGTVIEKTVSLGMVIASATGSVSGGTTIIKMADLSQVRMRVQFNETDIGQIRSGLPAVVIVDAYPERRFNGSVEKIEPQAVVSQGVTLFPVLVTLSNSDGALKPGMNGEVQVQIDVRENVLSVPNDAVKTVRDAMTTAPMLGLDPDSVQTQIRAQMGNRGGMGGGMRNGTGGGNAGNRGGSAGGRTSSSPGEVELPPQGGGPGGRGQGGFQGPQVTDQQCADVKAALAKKPALAKRLEDISTQMRNPDADRATLREEQTKLYTEVGVDARTAGSCRMREMRAAGGQAGGNQRGTGDASGALRGATNGAPNSANGGASTADTRPAQTQQGQPQLQMGNAERGLTGQRVRQGLVFVAKGKTYEPRVVMLGASNFDYTEVVSGLEEGEQVAMLAAIALQAQRQQQTDRFRQNMGGGVPGMSSNQSPGGGGRPGGR